MTSWSEQLADARAEIMRLSGLAEQASDRSRKTADRLMANEEAVQRIEVERAALEGRYSVLKGENTARRRAGATASRDQ